MNNFKIDFLGIGAQRCGTTWIAKCLKEHPQICLSSPKEIHFFDTDKYKFGLDWYQKHFDCKKNQIKGEFDAGYLITENAAQQIKNTFPNVKLIACLRNPIDRAFSNYLSVFGFDQSIGSFEETIKRNPENLERGLYAKYLKKYLALFAQENILILIYEDIQKNPLKFIQKIYQFLEVDNDFIPNAINRKENPSQGYRCPGFKRKTGQMIKKMENTQQGLKLKKLLKKLGFKKLLNSINKLNRKELKQKPELNPKTRNYLQEYYREDIKELEKLIQRDLSFWQ